MVFKRKAKSSNQSNSRTPKRVKTLPKNDIKQEVKTENHEDQSADEAENIVDDYENPETYEQIRLKNIEEKMKMLQSMKIHQVKQEFQDVMGSAKKENKPSHRGMRIKKTPQVVELRPKSLRLQGMNPDMTQSPKILASGFSESPPEFVIPEGPLQFSDAVRDGDDVELAEQFRLSLQSLKQHTKIPQTSYKSQNSLKEHLQSMKINEKQVAKVVPSRIFSMEIYPGEDKTLVFAGDKWGHLGIWNIHEENDQDGVYVYRPHTRPINCMKFVPGNTAQMLSLSYDGTVRKADFNKSVFDEVFLVPDEERHGCSYFDYLSNDSIVISLTNGTVAIKDMREPLENYKTYEVNDNRRTLKTICVHPTNQKYFITNGTAGPVTLWDVRQLKKSGGKPVVSLPGIKTTNSAFFSPVTGNKIITTSKSDVIKIYDSKKLDSSISLLKSIRHNNNTGRWLSSFKATWLPHSEQSFIVGCMDYPRCIEVMQESGQLMHSLVGEDLSSICSTTVVHPSLDVIAGGNSSGRVYIFTK